MNSQLFNNGALFLEKRGKFDEAEGFYRKAFELGLHRQIGKLMTNFALLLWRVRMNYEEAEQIYRLALDTYPNSPRVNLHFAAFLLARGQFAEAADRARKTLALCGESVSIQRKDFVAKSLLYLGLGKRIDGTEDNAELGKLKSSQLHTGFQRYEGRPFDVVLKVALERLQDEDRQLYAALAAAVRNENKVRDLDVRSRWKTVPAVDSVP